MKNKEAVVESREAYLYFMITRCGDQPCMNVTTIELEHHEGEEQAMSLFASKRNQPSEKPEDSHKQVLSKVSMTAVSTQYQYHLTAIFKNTSHAWGL